MAPKRERSGAERRFAFVVAPITVNGGRSIERLRAEGPLPTIRFSERLSSAGYSISSTGLESRWTSSMKRISFGSMFVRIAARLSHTAEKGVVIALPDTDEWVLGILRYNGPQ